MLSCHAGSSSEPGLQDMHTSHAQLGSPPAARLARPRRAPARHRVLPGAPSAPPGCPLPRPWPADSPAQHSASCSASGRHRQRRQPLPAVLCRAHGLHARPLSRALGPAHLAQQQRITGLQQCPDNPVAGWACWRPWPATPLAHRSTRLAACSCRLGSHSNARSGWPAGPPMDAFRTGTQPKLATPKL